MSNNIIEIKNLYRKFGKFTALNGINLSLKKGEILGLLGPNGAGKTTTIKIITGLLPPDSGTVKLMDLSAETEWDIRRQSWLLVAKMAVGHKYLRPECCVELRTGSPT